MHSCCLLLGSNLGEREIIISKALTLIKLQIGQIVMVSAMYETEPWGFHPNQYFLNQAVIVETPQQPRQILDLIHKIEKELGRDRINVPGYASRTIDIDILFYDDEIISTESLTIPHPQLHNRKFALIPLCEISPAKIHPVLQKNHMELLEGCSDQSTVRIYKKATANKINTGL